MPKTSSSSTSDDALLKLPYHERQTPFRQLCLMHALNMFVGEPRLDQVYMDQVCDRLVQLSSSSSFLTEEEQQQQKDGDGTILSMLTTNNPHKGKWLGGNYDVNVALYILENEWNYQVNYYRKKQKKPHENNIDDENDDDDELALLDSLEGLLVNVRGTFRWTRHWIMYKQWGTGGNNIEDEASSAPQWYRLDSKASRPIVIPNIQAQVDQHLLQSGDTVLMIQKKQEG